MVAIASLMATTRTSIDTAKTDRYQAKRDTIVQAATDLINERGIRSMTFVDVAQRVNLNTTSITYYFKRKDLLAEAAFEIAMDANEEMVARAANEPTPRARVAKYIELEMERQVGIRRRELPHLARLSEVRALDDPVRDRLGQRYVKTLRTVRRIFGPDTDAATKARNVARAHFLLENVYYLPRWLTVYSDADFDRVRSRIMEIFDGGIAGLRGRWSPHTLELPGPIAPPHQAAPVPQAFLRAATDLINQRGYRGASVDRIASQLDVTKGSFYHHLDAKDDLVLQCFERSHHFISGVQRSALQLDATSRDRLASALNTLLDVQLYGDFPLLRTSSLQALPAELRTQPRRKSDQIAQRFASMLIDGISDGSIRPIDPFIAGQLIMVAINAAYQLRSWAGDQDALTALETYSGILSHGLFDIEDDAAS